MERMDWVNKPSYSALLFHTIYAPILFLLPLFLTCPIAGEPTDLTLALEKLAPFVAPAIVLFGLISVIVDLVRTWKDEHIREKPYPFSVSVGFGLCAIHGTYEVYGRPVNPMVQTLAYLALFLTLILLLKKIRLINVTKKIRIQRATS